MDSPACLIACGGRGRCIGADGRRRKGRMCCGPCPTLITSLLAATNSDSGDGSSPDDCNSGHGSDSGNGRHGSYKGNSRRRNKIHGDMHASDACGGRQQRSLVLVVARHGLAPCPRIKTNFDEAIEAPRTALLLPIEWLQSRLSFSSTFSSGPTSDRQGLPNCRDWAEHLYHGQRAASATSFARHFVSARGPPPWAVTGNPKRQRLPICLISYQRDLLR